MTFNLGKNAHHIKNALWTFEVDDEIKNISRNFEIKKTRSYSAHCQVFENNTMATKKKSLPKWTTIYSVSNRGKVFYENIKNVHHNCTSYVTFLCKSTKKKENLPWTKEYKYFLGIIKSWKININN